MRILHAFARLSLVIIAVLSLLLPSVSAHLGAVHSNPIEGAYHAVMVLIEVGPATDLEFAFGLTYADAYQALILSNVAIFAAIFALIALKLKAPMPLVFGALFVIASFSTMFMEGIFQDVQIERPSMVLMHMDEKIQNHFYNYPILTNFSQLGWTEKDILFSRPDLAAEKPIDMTNDLQPKVVVEGNETIKVFSLVISGVVKEISPGVFIEAWAFNGQVPGPTMRVKEGERVRVTVFNTNPKAHNFQLNGIPLDAESDAFPLTGKIIQPGQFYTYEFIAKKAGTYWYNCNVEAGHHVDMGLQGVFIVDPVDKNETDVQERVLVLDDWDTDHAHGAMAGSGPYGAGYFIQDSSPREVVALAMDTYTINGKAFPLTEPIIIKEVGQKVRLTFVNTGFSRFTMHLHGHLFNVTDIDGNKVTAPYVSDTIDMGPGQRFTVEFTADNPGVWALHEHSGKMTTRGIDLGGALTFVVYEGHETPQYISLKKAAEFYVRRVRIAEDLGFMEKAPDSFASSVMMSGGGMGGMGH